MTTQDQLHHISCMPTLSERPLSLERLTSLTLGLPIQQSRSSLMQIANAMDLLRCHSMPNLGKLHVDVSSENTSHITQLTHIISSNVFSRLERARGGFHLISTGKELGESTGERGQRHSRKGQPRQVSLDRLFVASRSASSNPQTLATMLCISHLLTCVYGAMPIICNAQADNFGNLLMD